jgi:hypothetical protein
MSAGSPRPVSERLRSFEEALDFLNSKKDAESQAAAAQLVPYLERLRSSDPKSRFLGWAGAPDSPSEPAGEVEPGSLGSGARSARGVLEAPGGAVRVAARGAQLELTPRALVGPPVETQECAYCDRGAVLRVGDGDGEPRCMRHLGGPEARLPDDVRRFARGR